MLESAPHNPAPDAHMAASASTLPTSTANPSVMDDALPGESTKQVIEYVSPFDQCERDCAVVWAHFEHRIGENG